MKKTRKKVILTPFNGKEAKTFVDCKEILLVFGAWSIQNYPNHFITNIITTFAEIQEIMYAPYSKRSIQSVFILRNMTFYHALVLKIHLQGKIKSMASRKFFGSFYDSLVKHSPEHCRNFSGRIANTEKEEATFNFLKKTTNLASNHHPADVIANATIYQPIKSVLENTTIPYAWIRKYKYQYQCLLQSQADFISDEVYGWRELEDGIEFCDISNCPNSKKQLSHSQSTSIAEEVNHIEECWNHLLSLKHKIPAYKIQVKSSLNKSENVDLELSNLSHFSEKTKCDNEQQRSSSNSIEIKKSFTKSNSTIKSNSLQTSIESNNNEIDFFSSTPL